jgi:hypothetical protein
VAAMTSRANQELLNTFFVLFHGYMARTLLETGKEKQRKVRSREYFSSRSEYMAKQSKTLNQSELNLYIHNSPKIR